MTTLRADLESLSFPQGITTVGVELEGYWERPEQEEYMDMTDMQDCEDCYRDEDGEISEWCYNHDPYHQGSNLYDHLGIKSDGSVHCDGHWPEDYYVAGEAVSHVLHSWAGLCRWLDGAYPYGADYKTGMHVHMGCTKQLLDFSFDPHYWEHLKATLLAVGKDCAPATRDWLQNRIYEGRSSEECDTRYCRPNEWSTYSRNERYNAVNYTSFDCHGTMEVRVCPMAEDGYTPDGRFVDAATQSLALIYGVLKATSDYWTSVNYWHRRVGSATAMEDITLTDDPAVQVPPNTHRSVVV